MKNFLIIMLILILPVSTYLFLNKNSSGIAAIASDSNNPSILIYTSAMCLDCRKMKDVISEIEGSCSDKINFISIDALDNNRKIQESIKKYDIKVVPTLVFTDVNGKEINKIEGFISKEELMKKIEEAINE